MKISAQLNVENFEHMAEQPGREFEWLRLDTNYNCNVHCVYCHSSRSKEVIPTDQLERFLEHNVLSLENVQFGCVMEPTLDPRLTELMHLVANSNQKPTGDMVVQTNGLMLHRHDPELMLSAGLTHMSVSIDTVNSETLARLRGGSSFNKVSNNVIDFKKKCPSVALQILSTITTANINELDDLIRWGIDIGAERFVFREVFHYPNNDIVNHEETLKLMLARGEFQKMQDRVNAEFGDRTNFHFSPAAALRSHAVKVFKQSYEKTDGA